MLVAKGKGSGTVTLRVTDNLRVWNVIYVFDGASGSWVVPYTTNGSQNVDYRINISAEKNYTVQVLGSTVADFYIGLRNDPAGASRRPVDYTFNGLYIDQISKAEAGASFVIRANLRGSLPFASCDLSQLKQLRGVTLGLGTDSRGRSAGVVNVRSAVSRGNIEAGPGTIWSFWRASHEQALVPSGLVDIVYELGRARIRFYAGSQFVKNGDFYALPAGLPTAYYQYDSLGSSGGEFLTEITRAIGTDVSVLRLANSSSSEVARVYAGTYAPGTYLCVERVGSFSTLKYWPWHRVGASLPGLIKHEKSMTLQRQVINSSGDFSYVSESQWAYSAPTQIEVRSTVYQSSTPAGVILHQEVVRYPDGDQDLVLSPVRTGKGIGGDYFVDYPQDSTLVTDQQTGAVTRHSWLNTGGKTIIELFRNRAQRSAMNFPSNIGSQPPVRSASQRKCGCLGEMMRLRRQRHW